MCYGSSWCRQGGGGDIGVSFASKRVGRSSESVSAAGESLEKRKIEKGKGMKGTKSGAIVLEHLDLESEKKSILAQVGSDLKSRALP